MYGIAYVQDTDLPDEQDWVVIETTRGDVYVLMKHSAVCRGTLADAWAAVRRVEHGPSVPPQRSHLQAVI